MKLKDNNNRKDSYKGFIRSSKNTLSTTNHYQISLPPHVYGRMDWRVNQKVRILTDKKNGVIIIKQGDEDVDVQ